MSQPGLRERKKERTRRAIFDATLSLFLRKGFEATTVEEIARTADVAPRTFFRYFPTKEDVIFLDQDLEDRFVVETLKRREPGESHLEALLRASSAVPLQGERHPDLKRLVRLVIATPALLARAAQVLTKSQRRLAEALAGAEASDAERRRAGILVGAYIGAFVAAMVSQLEAREQVDLRDIANEVASLLRSGFSEQPRRKRGRGRSGTS